LLLISVSFCASSAKNADKFPSILNQFVELNEAIGVEKADVGVIVAQVKNSLSSGKKQFANFFRAVEAHCSSAVAGIKTTIKELNSSINDAKSNQNNWTKNLASATADAKDAKANIVKARGQLVTLRKRISKITLNYRVYAEEADKKLNVVKVLRDIITDELFNKAPGALVQVNKFQEKLAELKGLLNNNSDSLYSPIVSVLLDLATEQNFSDQGVLRKILQNLNNLDKALKDFRAKQEKSFGAELKNIRKQIKNVKQRIRAYRRMRTQAISKRIDAQHYLTFYGHEIVHFNAEKGRKETELHMFKKLCAFEKRMHKRAVKTYKFFTTVAKDVFARVQKIKSAK